MNIRERFGRVGFTPEEKMDLTARLERAAEQEETMTDATKRNIKRISGGMIFGIAAAAVMTVGALAAVLNPGLRTWFDTTAPGASEMLESSIYRIDRSETYNGWTVTLAECVGDENSVYIWADVTAPEGTVLAPPENGGFDLAYRLEDWDGTAIVLQEDNDPTDNRISMLLQTRSMNRSLRGETVTVKVGPILDHWWEEDPETGEWSYEKGSELVAAIQDHEWVFEDVELDYPDQTIRLEPNVEIPWLDGTTTVTKLEVSPLSTYVTVEGGSCGVFVDHANTPFSDGGEVIISSGGITITGGLDSDTEWFSKRQEMEAALTIELAFLDGTQLSPYHYMTTSNGWREGAEGPETPYFSVGRMYDYTDLNLEKMVSRVVNPAQVDHVTICGVDIPVDPENTAE